MIHFFKSHLLIPLLLSLSPRPNRLINPLLRRQMSSDADEDFELRVADTDTAELRLLCVRQHRRITTLLSSPPETVDTSDSDSDIPTPIPEVAATSMVAALRDLEHAKASNTSSSRLHARLKHRYDDLFRLFLSLQQQMDVQWSVRWGDQKVRQSTESSPKPEARHLTDKREQ